MINGIGVDLVDKARFINLVKKFGNRVATKILSKDEYLEYKNISNKPSFLSKRFAAKEALSKALGVGLYRKGIYPKYISVKHNDLGKPSLSLSSSSAASDVYKRQVLEVYYQYNFRYHS